MLAAAPPTDFFGGRHGGRIDFISRDLAVEVLPRHMFDHIDVDMTEMEIGDVITVADLEDKLPESGKFLEDPNRVVVLVELPRIVEEEEGQGKKKKKKQKRLRLLKKKLMKVRPLKPRKRKNRLRKQQKSLSN